MESALKLTYVHLQFENFSEAYRHKYRRQCVDFCMESALKLTYVHLQFENFSEAKLTGINTGVNVLIFVWKVR
jgi:hypothetical protein